MTETESAPRDLGQQIASGAAWVVAARLAVRSIGLVSTLILARLLVPADFGLIALATLIAASVELLSAFNFDVWLIRYPNPTRDHYNTVWTLSVIRGVITAFILLPLAYPASLFFDEPRLVEVLQALAGGSVLLGLQNVGVINFRKHLQFDKEFLLLAISKFGAFLVTVSVAYIYRSYWALVTGIISGYALNFALSYLMHSYRPNFCLTHGREIFNFSKWLMLSNLLGFVYVRADTLIVGKLLNAQTLGLYTVAYEISTLATSELVAPIRQVLLPGYSKISNDLARMKTAFIDGLGIILLIGMPCSLGTGLVAEPLVRVLLGDKWLETIPLVQILVLYGLSSVAMANLSPLLLSLGRTRLISRLYGLGVLILLPGFLWANLHAGISGGAWALGICNSLLFLISLMATLRVLKLSVKPLIKGIWRIVIASMSMLLIVLAAQQTLMQNLAPIIQLFCYALLGCLAYIASLLLLWRLCHYPDGAEKIVIEYINKKLRLNRLFLSIKNRPFNVADGNESKNCTTGVKQQPMNANQTSVNGLSVIPATLITFIERRPFLHLCARVSLLLLAYILFERFVSQITHLSESAYQQPWLLWILLKNLEIFKLVFVIFLSVFLIRYGNLVASWQVMPSSQLIRGFIVFLASIMAWAFVCQGYNFYFGQTYLMDRLSIFILVPLLWWRPVFIYPFIVLCYLFMWQWVTPAIGGSILAHKLQVIKILNLFAAGWALQGMVGRRRCDDLFFLAGCLLVGAYWEAALAKIELDWLSYGHLSHALLAAYAHGWLAILDPSVVIEYAHWLDAIDLPMQVFVLLIEAGCLLFFLHRNFAVFLLLCLSLFHLGVFAMYGFLFWPWILLNLALITILLKTGSNTDYLIFDSNHLIVSVLLIGFASHWASPWPLGWFDTRLSYTTKYTAIGKSGKQYPLSPRFFEPYGDVFTLSSFSYLIKEHKFLAGPYGVSFNREVADKLIEPLSTDQVLTLEKELGDNRYNAARANSHYAFLRRYINNWNQTQDKVFSLKGLGPPAQFWFMSDQPLFAGNEPIRQVIITEVTQQFDNESLRTIRRQTVALLDIP